jgi:hypothetical protein
MNRNESTNLAHQESLLKAGNPELNHSNPKVEEYDDCLD